MSLITSMPRVPVVVSCNVAERSSHCIRDLNLITPGDGSASAYRRRRPLTKLLSDDDVIIYIASVYAPERERKL